LGALGDQALVGWHQGVLHEDFQHKALAPGDAVLVDVGVLEAGDKIAQIGYFLTGRGDEAVPGLLVGDRLVGQPLADGAPVDIEEVAQFFPSGGDPFGAIWPAGGVDA